MVYLILTCHNRTWGLHLTQEEVMVPVNDAYFFGGGYLLFTVKVAITHSDYHSDASFLSNAGMQVPLCHLERHPALLLPPNSISDCAAVSVAVLCLNTLS